MDKTADKGALSNITPIRPDVAPRMDITREMLQYVSECLNDYVAEHGEPPVSIAFVLIGPDKGDSVTNGYSWSPGDEDKSRLQSCAVASAVLMKRALGL